MHKSLVRPCTEVARVKFLDENIVQQVSECVGFAQHVIDFGAARRIDPVQATIQSKELIPQLVDVTCLGIV